MSELQEENQLLAEVLAQLLTNQQLTTKWLTLSSAAHLEQATVANVTMDPVRVCCAGTVMAEAVVAGMGGQCVAAPPRPSS